MEPKAWLLLTALVLSALFSGAETALTAVRRIKLDVWVKQGIRGALRTRNMISHPDRYLVTTLVGNNLVVVAASSLIAIFLQPYLNGFLITLVSSFFILFWCEILPKTIAADQPTRLSLYASLFIRTVTLILYPFIQLTRLITRAVIHWLGFRNEELVRVFSRKDMAHVLDEGHRTGILEDQERDMINRFILRSDCKLREIMVPRTEMVTVESNSNLKLVRDVFENTGYSRLPVFDQDLDHIVGIVTLRDVMLESPDSIQNVLRPAIFLPDMKKVLESLKVMQKQHAGLAIVVDEYGGTAGLVTLEDMVEEFFGEILDEFDKHTDWLRKEDSETIEVNARVEIDILNQYFGFNLEEGEYQTLSGLLMAEAGHIPKRGETITLSPSLEFTILSSNRKKINWVQIKRDKSPPMR